MPEELCAGVNTLGIAGCRVLTVLERQGGGRRGDTHLHCQIVENPGLCAKVRDGRDVRAGHEVLQEVTVKGWVGSYGVWAAGGQGLEKENMCVCVLSERCR